MADPLVGQFSKKSWDFIMTPPEQDKRYTLLYGAVRSSKSWTMNAKLIVQLSRYEVEGKRFITGVSKSTVFKNMLLDVFAVVGRSNYSYNATSGELWLLGKQYFVCGARDESSYKNILGSTVGIHIGDEAIEYPKSFMAQMFLRMSPERARCYLTLNPGSPFSYLKSEVIDNPAMQPDIHLIHYDLDDNPHLSLTTKNAIKASQRGVYYQRYVLGQFCVAEGSIYKDAWDEKENTCTNKTEPITLRNPGGYVDHWYAIDAGVDHPQVTYEFYDTGDIIYVTREDVWDSHETMQQRTDAQYAVALEKFMGGKKEQVFVPPEAASFRAELLERGFWVTDADNAVTKGIHTVCSMLARRKLIVNRTGCPRLFKSIPVYSWDPKAAKLGEEAPLKLADDEVDCLRYGVHSKVMPWRLNS